MTVSTETPRRTKTSATAPLPSTPARKPAAMAKRSPATPARSSPATSRSQGPAQRVWIAMCEPAVLIRSGARTQKARARRIPPRPRSCRPRGSGASAARRSGTTRKITSATARQSPARPMKASRQPQAWTAHSIGRVATSRPSAPKDMTQALASGRRGSGTQSTTALKPLIRPPAKPSPISARAAVRVATSRPKPKSSAPAAAQQTSAACTRRGP